MLKNGQNFPGLVEKKIRYTADIFLKSLYYSFVYSYLVYGSCVWGGTYPSHLNPLIILHKRIIRIINCADFLSHTNDLFYSCSLLKLPEIYKFRILMHMYKNIENFDTIEGITRSSGLLREEYHRLEGSNMSITYIGPKFWNNLPSDIQGSSSLNTFKNNVNKLLYLGMYNLA